MSDDLEQYVLLAKQATGKALEALVETVIASPSIHSFTALLEMPNVQSMAGTEYGGMLELLKIFSYGTYADYIQHRTSLPIINDLATHKLKKLTLISLAATQHHLSYASLMRDLDVASTRELEDLVIEATYEDLIKAKLNTRTQSVYVESSVGRDLASGNGDDDGSNTHAALDRILASLDAWSRNCDDVLLDIQRSVEQVRHAGRTRRGEATQHGQALAQLRRKIMADGPGGSGTHGEGHARPGTGSGSGSGSFGGSAGGAKRSAGFEGPVDDVMDDEDMVLVEGDDARLNSSSSSSGTGPRHPFLPETGTGVSGEYSHAGPSTSGGGGSSNGGGGGGGRKRKTPTPKRIGSRQS